MDRESQNHSDYDRLTLGRLIMIRTKELELRQRVAPRLRGRRRAENAAEIAALLKGIKSLYRRGLARLRQSRSAQPRSTNAIDPSAQRPGTRSTRGKKS